MKIDFGCDCRLGPDYGLGEKWRFIPATKWGPLLLERLQRMVADGWALLYLKYSKDYVRAEEFAKARKEGMWRTEFVPPWEWR